MGTQQRMTSQDPTAKEPDQTPGYPHDTALPRQGKQDEPRDPPPKPPLHPSFHASFRHILRLREDGMIYDNMVNKPIRKYSLTDMFMSTIQLCSMYS